MKKSYKLLYDYFKTKYNLSPLKTWRYISDELGCDGDGRYVSLVANEVYKDLELDKLAEETVKTLLPDG